MNKWDSSHFCRNVDSDCRRCDGTVDQRQEHFAGAVRRRELLGAGPATVRPARRLLSLVAASRSATDTARPSRPVPRRASRRRPCSRRRPSGCVFRHKRMCRRRGSSSGLAELLHLAIHFHFHDQFRRARAPAMTRKTTPRITACVWGCPLSAGVFPAMPWRSGAPVPRQCIRIYACVTSPGAASSSSWRAAQAIIPCCQRCPGPPTACLTLAL